VSNFDKIINAMKVCESEVKSAGKKVLIAKLQVGYIQPKSNVISLNGNAIPLPESDIENIIKVLKDNLKAKEEKLNIANKNFDSFKNSVTMKETKNNKKEV